MSEIRYWSEPTGMEVAVVGMACRVPGARDLADFWRNLAAGEESLTRLSDDDLVALGESEEAIADPHYVRVARAIDDVDLFDAAFFGFNPREAEVMDPQQRLFLELAWEAMDNAGYDTERYPGLVGIFAGCRLSNYLLNLYSNPRIVAAMGDLQIQIGNDKDYIASRVAYKLGLRGPAVAVQSACSTSLVAVHLGSHALLAGEVDMVLAGAVNLKVPQTGYFHRAGEIYSEDGRIRTFSADAGGTIFGNGLAMVVLKRLEDALADGDNVRAVIKGSAINNDGPVKAGYTAPAAAGQSQVIRAAQHIARVDAGTITYVEAHGTGTPTGDPIEVSALTDAFRESTDRRQYCALGAVKTNVGHLSSAAGVTGLIKTVLALEHGQIPPSLNFSAPNPQIDFASSPFYVATELTPWPRPEGLPRRAGVSAFGIGGTNAHVIVEEAPVVPPTGPSRPWQIVALSARTDTALDVMTERLAAHLAARPEPSFADLCFTLQVGRRRWEHRRFAVCRDAADARAALADPGRMRGRMSGGAARDVAFLFSGQGAQYAGMGRRLYEREAVFRDAVDHCAGVLAGPLGLDLAALLFPEPGAVEEAARRLAETRYTQPALFTIEWALAGLWRSWGVEPAAMAGHSIGEYVAAAVAGVMALDDALALVAERGRLMQSLPGGSMLAVPMDEEEVVGELDGQLSIAALNAPRRTVVSGPDAAVEALAARLRDRGVRPTRLHTSHAFHSPMMEPILAPFAELVRGVELDPPRIPYVSNVSGDWITDDEATDPDYYALHLRRAVRFADGVGRLLDTPERVLLEVGPGKSLVDLARRHGAGGPGHVMVPSLGHPKDAGDDQAFLLGALGQLWLAGVDVDWPGFYAGETRRRVELPSYAFERRRFFIDMAQDGLGSLTPKALRKKTDLGDWYHLPYWRPSMTPAGPADAEPRSWLVFADELGLADRLAERLRAGGHGVAVVRAADGAAPFEDRGGGEYTVSAGDAAGHRELVTALVDAGQAPERVVHMFSVGPLPAGGEVDEALSDELLERGFWSLLHLERALGRHGLDRPVKLAAVTSHMQAVAGESALWPEKAAILGPVKVGAAEYPDLSAVAVDMDLPANGGVDPWVDAVLAEAAAAGDDVAVVAYRAGERYVQGYGPAHLPPVPPERSRLRRGGVYLITGGLGGLGLTFAEWLADEVGAKLVLLGATPLPEPATRDAYLAEHDAADRTALRIRKVRELEARGAEVLVLAADVADREQMERAVASAKARFGAVHGVIHAAGVAGGGLIQLKSDDAAARVLRPKIRGTRVLKEVLRDEPLDFNVLCSSTIAVLGSVGQVDYCAANNFLDAFAHAERLAGGPYTLSLDWGAWEEVGMAVAAGLVGGGRRGSASSGTGPAIHPLLERCVSDLATGKVYETDLEPARHWPLAEHRVAGLPTLPGTSHLEIGRAAYAHHAGESAAGVEIRDVFFVTPIMIPEDGLRTIRVTLEKEDGHFNYRVATAAGAGRGGELQWQPHVLGKIGPLDAGPAPRHDPRAIIERCSAREVVIEETRATAVDKGLVSWGPRWQSLKVVRVGDGESIAELELPAAFVDADRPYELHPATLDVATGMLSFIEKESFLPFSYGRVLVRRPLAGGTLYSHLVKTGADGETITADVVLMTAEGEELVRVERFTMKKVDRESAARLQASVEPAAKAPAAGPAGGPRTAGTGIFPEEGVEVMRRALGRGFRRPQAVISSRDLAAVVAQAREATRAAVGAAAGRGAGPPQAVHPRPGLTTPYAAPESPTQEVLAGIWQSVLGLEQVGIHDNFFELGGDSVIGVQVISQANDAGVKLTPDQLFEHQTVAELAALADAGSDAGAEAAEAEDDGEAAAFADSGLDQDQLEQVFSKLGEL